MEFILNNPFARMYGPYFLIFYGVFILFIILFLQVVKRLVDSSKNYPIPNISNQVDPFEISYLRGKESELARSVIFSLMKKDYLEFSETKTSIRRKNRQNHSNLSKIENAALEWLGEERSTGEIFGSNGLVRQLESYARVYKQKLENEQLLNNGVAVQRYKMIKYFALASVLAFGGYKVLAAFANGRRNVWLIFIFAFIGFKLINYFADLPRVSKLGQIYLSRLQLTFESLKSHTQNLYSKNGIANTNTAQPVTLAGIDPILLSVGVFGGGILAGTIYDNYNQAFAKSIKQNTQDYGSCGLDCGSCSASSSGSGSSCSSCSSCGGGCGGCGGCS